MITSDLYQESARTRKLEHDNEKLKKMCLSFQTALQHSRTDFHILKRKYGRSVQKMSELAGDWEGKYIRTSRKVEGLKEQIKTLQMEVEIERGQNHNY